MNRKVSVMPNLERVQRVVNAGENAPENSEASNIGISHILYTPFFSHFNLKSTACLGVSIWFTLNIFYWGKFDFFEKKTECWIFLFNTILFLKFVLSYFFLFILDELSCAWRLKFEKCAALSIPGQASENFRVLFEKFQIFCCIFFQSKLTKFFRAHYDGEGGRRSEHLIDLVDLAISHILVIVGDNDVKTQKIGYILQKFLEFKQAFWPSKVKFAGHMRRGDLDPLLVANNNIFLSENLGVHYKSTKLIKPNDFHAYDCHFDVEGEGYRHLAALILAVLEEFVRSW